MRNQTLMRFQHRIANRIECLSDYAKGIFLCPVQIRKSQRRTRFGRTFQNGHAIFHSSSQRTVDVRTALSLELVCVIGLPQTAQKVLDTMSAQMTPIHSTGNLSRRIRPCWLGRSSRCVTVLSLIRRTASSGIILNQISSIWSGMKRPSGNTKIDTLNTFQTTRRASFRKTTHPIFRFNTA